MSLLSARPAGGRRSVPQRLLVPHLALVAQGHQALDAWLLQAHELDHRRCACVLLLPGNILRHPLEVIIQLLLALVPRGRTPEWTWCPRCCRRCGARRGAGGEAKV